MLTVVDPVPALVVIDLQKGLMGIASVHPMADVVARSVALVEAFRAKGFPVTLVTATGVPPGRTDRARGGSALPTSEGWADLIDELAPGGDDIVVRKQTRSAFHGTGLGDRLRGLGVTQVFVVGVATSAGAEETARQAYADGFHVVAVVDAMTDRDEEAHDYSVRKAFPSVAEVTTTADVLAALGA